MAGFGLILVVTGGMAGAREYRRARLRSEYLAQARRTQEADSIQREIRRHFPERAPSYQPPPCPVKREPKDHMPIASVQSKTDRMPVANRICNDSISNPNK